MLRSLTLKRFQKHQDLTVELDRRVTTVVGATDAGKSAVLRALAFLCLNKWSPAYLRHGAKTTVVRLTVGDQVVTRTKGPGVNAYKVGRKVFRAFGSQVPPDVEAVLNTGPENFQRQLDQHFWFSDTAGAVSKKLNAIVNLGAIDDAIGNVGRRVRESRSAVEVTARRLAEATERRDALAWVRRADDAYQVVEDSEQELTDESHRIARVRSRIEEAQSLTETVDRVSGAILDAKAVLEAGEAARRVRAKLTSLKKLTSKIDRAVRLKDTELPDLTELTALRKAGDDLAERRRSLEALVEEASTLEAELWQSTKALETSSARLGKMSKGRCPACGRPLNRSPSSSPTYTCVTRHRFPGPRKATPGTPF
jgi:chromosome segregation ATPase